ncbi:hypothetical protein MHI48_09550 [Paenibacillus sp. FSL H7-0942]|uniref:hypothetical protein n=1 Tax=unclassified Paenibacillus TaxID=185978 RepID=UPI000C6C97FE|nr:hypothetical protein [Paenibacillus sp. BGI2013]PKQ92735.1 hypothetical protein CXK86_01030 [Paenibacillus sp. BGI2013]
MKLLRILAWLFVPFIMIFVSWKKLGKVAKIGGAIWAGFILLIIVIPTEEKPNVTATVETDAVASQEKAPKVEKAVAVVDTKTEKKDDQKAKEEAKLKNETDAAAKKANQKEVLAFEKSVYALEETMSPIMNTYQEAMTGLGNGTVDIYTVYEATENAQKAAKHLQSKFYNLDVPENLPKDVKQMLNATASNLSTAYYSKGKAFDAVLEFLDDQKPSHMSKFKEEISMADSFVMKGILKLMEAKTAVGLEVDSK